MPANSSAVANALASLLRGLPTTLLTTSSTQITASGSLQTVTPLAPNGMNGITNGTVLQVDAANPELVTATNCTGQTFQAVFTLNHIGTWTIGIGPNLFNTVKVGEVQDPTDISNYAAVLFQSRKSARYDTGWKANSEPTFEVECGYDMTGASTSTVDAAMMNALDILDFLKLQRYTLNAASSGVYVTLVDKDDQARWKLYPNGKVYRIGLSYFKVLQQHNLSITP